MTAQILSWDALPGAPVILETQPDALRRLFARRALYGPNGISKKYDLDIPAGAESEMVMASRSIMHEAMNVCRALDRNETLVSVARLTDSPDAFGIGALLHNIRKKDYIGTGLDLKKIIADCFTYEMLSDATSIISRHRVIRALRRMGYISKDLSSRQLKPAGTTPPARTVCALVSNADNISLDTIVSPARDEKIIRSRFRVIWILREVCGHSLSTIGQSVGNRDHTTIINSLTKAAKRHREDPAYYKVTRDLCAEADRAGVIQNFNLLRRPYPEA